MTNPILLSILSALATAGLIGLTTKQNASGDTTIFNSEGQPVVTLPSSIFTSEIPLTSFKANLVRVSGITATSKPAISQIKLINSAIGNRLLSISIVPDSAMQVNGSLEIETNGSQVLGIAEGALTDLAVIEVPFSNEGLLLNQNTTIEFFVYSPTGVAVALTALVITGVK